MRMTGVGKVAVGGVLLSVLGGCGDGGPTDTAARDVLLSFVDHLRAGATDAAYGELCSGTRDRFDAAAFTAYVSRQKKIQDLELASKVNAPETPVVGPTFAERFVFNLHLNFTDGTGETRYIPVVQDTDGTWRVCGDPY
ncbi:hypothetical protein [Virgisporangium aurantiacum]|uniref:DUF4878 domain-containing protein n=1 Tax=Virgisporangium aurantiacum TaxID=175570 RepID=A0A8J4E827_9ACTN|nr:hypothetical protein [Virgisporangium aurantiacum]GIJ64813.1 hypothetical protein Vau01_123290 [Virgisporangium aurantiacum]